MVGSKVIALIGDRRSFNVILESWLCYMKSNLVCRLRDGGAMRENL